MLARMDDAAHGSAAELVAALTLYVVLLALVALLGVEMVIPTAYYQLLDPVWLQTRPLESLYYLHAQPPLLNAGLAAAYALSSQTGLRPETLLWCAHAILGAFAVLAFVQLAAFLMPRPWIRRVCIVLFVAHPVLYLVQHQYFYTFHELVALLAIAWCVMRLVERPGVGRLAAVAVWVVLLVWTRSLFHWAWGLATIVAAGALVAPRLGRRGPIAVVAVALFALLAWPAKNAAEFGFFGSSSWRGLNLVRGLPPEEEFTALPRALPARYAGVAALSLPRKSDGSVNWNHYGVIEASRSMEQRAFASLRARPGLAAGKALRNYWNLTRFGGRHPYEAYYGLDAPVPAALEPWLCAWERGLLLDFRAPAHLVKAADLARDEWTPSGFLILFPALLFVPLLAIVRWRRASPGPVAVAAVLWSQAVWVVAMVLLVDGTEANRIRFSTEPGLILLVGWVVASSRATGRRHARAPVTRTPVGRPGGSPAA
jgi:hypothetical protein